MNVEDISDHILTAVIDGSKPVQFEFLGLQLQITNLRQRLRSKEITPPTAVGELKKFLAKYRALPSAQRDLIKLAR